MMYFFFSSRRRHTRYWRDWSSDVCSSDLRSRDEVGGWLRGIGVQFFPVVNWAERGVDGDGNSVPRFHLTWGTGKALVDAVWGKIQEHPRRSALTVRLRTRVVALLRDNFGGIDGVRLDDSSELRGQAVV